MMNLVHLEAQLNDFDPAIRQQALQALATADMPPAERREEVSVKIDGKRLVTMTRGDIYWTRMQ